MTKRGDTFHWIKELMFMRTHGVSSAQSKTYAELSEYRRKSRSVSGTINWWNILSTSHIMTTGCLLNLYRTPVSPFVRSGPVSRYWFRGELWYLAEQSKTTRSLFGFFEWHTPWWEYTTDFHQQLPLLLFQHLPDLLFLSWIAYNDHITSGHS